MSLIGQLKTFTHYPGQPYYDDKRAVKSLSLSKWEAARNKVIATAAAMAALATGVAVAQTNTHFLWNGIDICAPLTSGGEVPDKVSSYDVASAESVLNGTPLQANPVGQRPMSISDQSAADKANEILASGGQPYVCREAGTSPLAGILTGDGLTQFTAPPRVSELPNGRILKIYADGKIVIDTPG